MAGLVTGLAVELLVAAFVLLVAINASVICVRVTDDGPAEPAPRPPAVNVQLAPRADWAYPDPGHTPMRPFQRTLVGQPS